MSAVTADVFADAAPCDSLHFGVARQRRYVLAAILTNLLIWTIAGLYLLTVPPSYTSEWALIIPVSDMDARVNIADVGQAYGTTRSSYDSRSLDPRVNYKSILESTPVLASAADSAGIAREDFPRPRISLPDQSSIIELEVSAQDAQTALRYAEALNEAFRLRLADLRINETEERDAGIETAISDAHEWLRVAQDKLVEFKTEKGVFSSAQLDEMANAVVGLGARRNALSERLAGQQAWIKSAREHLGITSHQAAHALIVQSDSLFLAHYTQYVDATALLSEYAYKFGENHPRVLTQQKHSQAMFEKLAARAKQLHGPGLGASELKKLIILTDEKSREPMFASYVAAAVEGDRLHSELSAVDSQIMAMRTELEQLARNHATLEDLERRAQFAEAVFNSALGKIDVGRSNVYSSYPLIQNLVAPSAPTRPSAPILALVILGALVASAFVSTGLTLTWMRNKHACAA